VAIAVTAMITPITGAMITATGVAVTVAIITADTIAAATVMIAMITTTSTYISLTITGVTGIGEAATATPIGMDATRVPAMVGMQAAHTADIMAMMMAISSSTTVAISPVGGSPSMTMRREC